MFRIIQCLVGAVLASTKSRHELTLENPALRHQLAVLGQSGLKRPRLTRWDRLLWVGLSQVWSAWTQSLLIVKPDTVIRWHRSVFNLHWRWKSRAGQPGRPKIDAELRALIRQMAHENARRRILHANVTEHPTAMWLIQKIREAFAWETTAKCLLCDRDSVFSADVRCAIESMGMKVKRTVAISPWQNGVAERWIGCLRQSLLHHVLVLNEDHLRRLVVDYVAYHNGDRLHCTLERAAPNGRRVENRPSPTARVVSEPRLGGLHHRYGWQEAA
jgi:hypothetical protein